MTRHSDIELRITEMNAQQIVSKFVSSLIQASLLRAAM